MRFTLISPKRVCTVLVTVVLGGALAIAGITTYWRPQPATALSGSDFNAGHIIDDAVFTNSSAMSVQDIQNFLNSKVSCDTNGTDRTSHPNGSGGYYTDAQWTSLHYYGRSDGKDNSGNPIQFTCLNNYVENTSTLADNILDPSASIPGGISAAQIIWNTAQQYQINPEVILTTLQKEQGLVTDYWPWVSEFQNAMGYQCYDSTGCGTNYADFYEQVNGATSQFRYYLNHPNAFNYWVGQNYVQYSPNASCGGSVVTIQNPATAALYIYTPYQPDSAALNLTGGGDSCSSFGIRNFWLYFNEWFGSPLLPTDITSYPTSQHRITTVTFNNTLYTFYYDAFYEQLDLATRSQTGGNWNPVVFDGSSSLGAGRVNASIGSSVTAVVYDNSLQVFYYDQTDGTLRHAWTTDGATWNFENLDGNAGSVSRHTGNVGLNPTAVVNSETNTLQVFYYDKGEGDMRYAYSNASGWNFENLDGDAGSLGHVGANVGLMSTALDDGGSTQLFYYDITHQTLRHAWTDANGWHFETLDGLPSSNSHFYSSVGMEPTAVLYNGSIQLFYYDTAHQSLRHAWTDVSGWHFENLDGGGAPVSGSSDHTGIDPSVTLYDGSLQLYYYDATRAVFKHTWADASGWHFETLDGDSGSILHNVGDMGINSEVMAENNILDIFYYDTTNGNLEHAWSDANGWHFETTDISVVY